MQKKKKKDQERVSDFYLREMGHNKENTQIIERKFKRYGLHP